MAHAEGEIMKTMYIASFSYGKPNLARVLIEKETSKTISVFSHTNLLGWQWFGKRTHKEKLNMFSCRQEAFEFLLEKVRSCAKG